MFDLHMIGFELLCTPNFVGGIQFSAPVVPKGNLTAVVITPLFFRVSHLNNRETTKKSPWKFIRFPGKVRRCEKTHLFLAVFAEMQAGT